METDAGVLDSDAADLEGLATPIAPSLVSAAELPAAPENGAANGKPAKSLRQMAAHGSLWAIAGYGTSQVLRFGSNLVLAKLLFPQAFGLMAIVNGVMQGLMMLSDVGIGQSIIRHTRRDDPEFYNTAWTVQILRGMVLTLIGVALAWPIGRFYEPFLTKFVVVTALTALISGFNSTKLFTANRDLQLARLTMVDLTAQVLAVTVMVGFAWWRHSIWALVAGSLVSVSVRLVLSHLAFPGPGNRFCWRPDAARELFTFGRWIFVSTMFTFLGLQTDKLILGRLVPLDLLGVYAVAFAMTATVAGVFEHLVYRVLMPTMVQVSKVSNSRFAEIVLGSRRFILMGAAIAVADLIILAPAIFRFLYDSRYQGAAHMTQLLCCGLWFTLLQRTGEACLLATDKSRALAQANALNFLVTIVAAPAGFHWFGINGFIAGWTLGNLSAVIVLDWELVRHGVPVAWQDVGKTLLLFAFCAVGRVMQIAFHGYLNPHSLFWLADVLPAVVITLAGMVMLFLRNRSLILFKSGPLQEPGSA